MPDLQIADIFKDALPQAAVWGRVALSVGGAGFFVSLVLVALHVRDQVALRRGVRNPNQFLSPNWGPLSQALGEFFRDPIHNAPLSPDAAAEFVIGRLEAQREATQSIIRYFSYAPLLFGLVGTILALRALLVVSGNTLQEIQPHLAGVFAGTLAGILGSLLAAVGGLILDSASLSTVNRAQDFIHRYILPTLPERRIALRIEDAVLALITERTQAVVESFKNAIQPVAQQMEQIAIRCGNAAEASTKAFSEAARAVREAGDWEIASRNFKSGAHMIDSSAEQLSDAARQTAETILRIGELRQGHAELLERIRESAQTIEATNLRVTEDVKNHIADLKLLSEALQDNISSLHTATGTLTTELLRRATADSAQIDLIKSHAEATSAGLTALVGVSKQTHEALKSIPGTFELLNGIPASVEKAAQSLERSAEAVSKIAAQLSNRSDRDIPSDPVADTTFRDAAADFQKAVTQFQRVTESLQHLHDDESPTKKSNGFLRRLFGDN